MQRDRTFRIAGTWALATDGLQWVLQRRKGERWEAISFVHSTRDILARCMREKGLPDDAAAALLDSLPSTFDEWCHREGLAQKETIQAAPAIAHDTPPATLARVD